jgi:hypothetical protein
MDATVALLDLGFVPFCPLLSHFLDVTHPRDYQTWLDYDLSWLEVCDVVLRLPGESVGADVEVARAQELGIPVFFGLADLLQAFNRKVPAEASGFTEKTPDAPLADAKGGSYSSTAESFCMKSPYFFDRD